MRYIIALTTVFTMCMAASTVSPQEKQATAPVNDAQLIAADKKPKNEVELMLENARKSGETIIRTCLENCDEKQIGRASCRERVEIQVAEMSRKKKEEG